MSELPPLLRDQRKTDVGHLSLLSVFHFVLAALSLVGLGFLFLHWFMMHSIFENPEMWKNQKGGGPPPAEFFAVFKWFYVFFGAMIVLGGVANVVSGILIRLRRGRTFSLVVAGVDCMMFPFGTALGVLTLVVLLRESVNEVYRTSRE